MAVPTGERLQAACFLLLLAASAAVLAVGTRVEVDDVYIVLRTAENFAAGHGLVFSPGDGFMPVTCPLWTLLLGLVRTLCPTADLVEIARLTSLAFLCGATTLLFLLLRSAAGWAAVLLAPMILFAKEMPEHAGNEIGLATCLVAGALLARRRGRDTLSAVLVAACYLTRGEGVLLLPILFGPAVWKAWREHRLREHLGKLAVPAAVFLALVAAWHLYHLACFGSLMPKTLAVKMLQGRGGWPSYGSHVFPHLVRQQKHGWPIALLCLCGLPALLRSLPQLPIWAAVHVAFYSALRVPNYDWYYYPMFVVVPVAAVHGVAALRRLVAGFVASERWTRPLFVAVAGLLVWAWVPWPVPTANGERVGQYRAVAEWLSARDDVAARPLVLAFEIGIIGYYARALPMIDPPGILVPDLTKELLMDWHELVRRKKPVYLVFREALGDEVRVGDTVQGVEYRYTLVHTIPGDGYPQHIYRLRS